jgi:hypothetical protein
MHKFHTKPNQIQMIALKLSNGHSPQIRQNGELLVRMCRGESQKVSKSPLANVSECIESGLSRVANLANLANF